MPAMIKTSGSDGVSALIYCSWRYFYFTIATDGGLWVAFSAPLWKIQSHSRSCDAETPISFLPLRYLDWSQRKETSRDLWDKKVKQSGE